SLAGNNSSGASWMLVVGQKWRLQRPFRLPSLGRLTGPLRGRAERGLGKPVVSAKNGSCGNLARTSASNRCTGSLMASNSCGAIHRVATLDDLVERDKDHDCPGFGAARICVRVEAVAELPSRFGRFRVVAFWN